MPPPIPTSLADHARYALSLIERGDFKAAERRLKDILKSDPQQFDALRVIGEVQLEESRIFQNLEDAIGLFIVLREEFRQRDSLQLDGGNVVGERLGIQLLHVDAGNDVVSHCDGRAVRVTGMNMW